VKWLPRHHLVRLRDLGRRSRQVLLLAGMTGAVTGLAVAGFEHLTAEVLLEGVLGLPLWCQVGAPAVGLVVAAFCLRAGGRPLSPSTADEYIRSYHDPAHDLGVRALLQRLAAAVATLGLGAPLGYEGPALYAGAGIGAGLQRRLRRHFSAEDAKVLLVAGAAAGVAAIFKAPVTGLVFALEVPYQEDLARRMLLPAAISAAASYVVFAAIAGTQPILPVAGQPPFDLVDLGGAALVGLGAGVLARAFIAVVLAAKAAATRGHPAVRIAVAGGVLAGTVLVANALGDASLSLGPGYDALEWALDPKQSLVAIFALGTLRVAGTAATVGGGGVGGLFIPLVIQGALVGRFVGGAFDASNETLFPVVGMAAFLGAGYRVPLAAVVFVAEFTGRPGFVVPGLIAAVVAQLVAGRTSIAPYQVRGRIGHLERRLNMPVADVIDTEARTLPPDATVDEVFWHHMVGARQQAVAVVGGSTYIGLVTVTDLTAIDRETWPTTAIEDVLRPDAPVATLDWMVSDAVRAMDEHDLDRIAVCDGTTYVGVITASELVALDEVLDRIDPPA
jgi:CIC family chloride channel protein